MYTLSCRETKKLIPDYDWTRKRGQATVFSQEGRGLLPRRCTPSLTTPALIPNNECFYFVSGRCYWVAPLDPHK